MPRRGDVEECLSRPEITCVSVSTNGIRLCEDRGLLRYLAARKVVISLQYDGADDAVYERLRGARLLRCKMSLIDAASEVSARMSLTATVTGGVNEREVGGIARLAFSRNNIVSVTFQPAAHVGSARTSALPPERLFIPDVIRLLAEETAGLVKREDFSPLPCSHPACFSLAYYLAVGGGEYAAVKPLVDADRYLDMIRNRALFGTDEESFSEARDAVYDLWSGPAALTPDGLKATRAMKRLIEEVACCGAFTPARTLDVAERAMKSIFTHHFMDRWNFDLSRARKCCNVYPLADGRMMPACVYNCLSR